MKKTISLILAALFLFSLAACGAVGNEEQSTSTTPIPENTEAPASDAVSNAVPDETEQEPTAATAGKILVVYFSWSGNLDKMAHWVADETGGDLIRVTAKEAYPDNYNDTADRAKNEVDNGIRPEINVDLTPEQMAQYETVFFGFPVWWYDLPMSMWTFLESYDCRRDGPIGRRAFHQRRQRRVVGRRRQRLGQRFKLLKIQILYGGRKNEIRNTEHRSKHAAGGLWRFPDPGRR